MCLDSSSAYCVKQQIFFGVATQVGLGSLDGVFGLTPEYINGPPSFIGNLKRAGVIDNKMFALFISEKNHTSKLTLGGYDSSLIQKGDGSDGYGIHWFETETEG